MENLMHKLIGNWYGAELNRRLETIKKAKMDFTKYMCNYELDIFREEQANDAPQIAIQRFQSSMLKITFFIKRT